MPEHGSSTYRKDQLEVLLIFLPSLWLNSRVQRLTEILHKIQQGLNETLRDYINRFSRAALTISRFVDETGQSAFISNIHPSNKYKYLLGHQKTLTFSDLMEAATTHALTEERMNSFFEPEQQISHLTQSSRYNQWHYDTSPDYSQRLKRPRQVHVQANRDGRPMVQIGSNGKPARGTNSQGNV